MVYVVFLLFENQEAAAGEASKSAFFKLIPWIVLCLALLGAGLALYLKATDPTKYAIIGRIVLEDTVERD